jgi:hypothetical protein
VEARRRSGDGRAALLCLTILCACPSSSTEEATAAGGTSTSGASSSSQTATSSGTSGGGGGAAPDLCGACSAPVAGGSLANQAIDEASGLAASRVHEGVYYLHNDSGDSPRFFATDARGADLGSYPVTGAQAIDWEDMAVGPCGVGQSCLFLGDIGDNSASRASYVVYRVREPDRVAAGDHPVAGEGLPYLYPDGSHNSETLMAHPTSGELYVVSKVRSGISALYRFPMPLTPGVTVTLEKLGELAPPRGSAMVTGGDVHASLGVLLRSYSHAWLYPMRGGEVSDALAGAPCALPSAMEPQGETIAWLVSGKGFLTVSEGAGAAVHFTGCR